MLFAKNRKIYTPKGVFSLNTASEDYVDPFIHQRNMATPNVPAELEGEFRRWGYNTPIFISAPTGTGKSTWVIKSLIRHVMEQGGHLAIIYSRIAFGNQCKEQTLEEYAPELRKRFTAQGIQETDHFEGIPVTFCPYQRLEALMRKGVTQFTHVVFDEVQFFASDSTFAHNTWALLEQIPKKFSRAVRVYMTATPWAVQNLVAKAEQGYQLSVDDHVKHFGTVCPYPDGDLTYRPRMQMYCFPAPARNYKLHILPSEVRYCYKALLDLIRNIPTKEKGLIFVNSKENGKNLAEAIGKDATYLDAEHKGGEVWEEVTTKEKFASRVLVTTSVTDCGVNINDPAVKHVVLFSTDHVQFMQELGRKRLQKDEVVHLYVPELSPEQWRRMNAWNNQRLKIANDFYQYRSREQRHQLFERVYEGNDPVARHLLSIDSRGNVTINYCLEQGLCQTEIFFQELEEMWAAGDKHPFLRKVGQWLDLPDAALEDVLDGTAEGRLRRFLDQSCGQALDHKNKQVEFSNEFRKRYTAAFGSRKGGNRRTDPWGYKIISRLLQEQGLPYTLTVKKGIWQLTKKGEEVNTNE